MDEARTLVMISSWCFRQCFDIDG